MSFIFKIRLLSEPASSTRTLESKANALDYANMLAKEDDEANAELIVTRRSDQERVTHLSCPLHGITDYITHFSKAVMTDKIPRPEGRRRHGSKALRLRGFAQ